MKHLNYAVCHGLRVGKTVLRLVDLVSYSSLLGC